MRTKEPTRCYCGAQLTTNNVPIGTKIKKFAELDDELDYVCLCGKKYTALLVLTDAYNGCWFRILEKEVDHE